MGLKQFEAVEQQTAHLKKHSKSTAMISIDELKVKITMKKASGHLSKKQTTIINGFVIIIKALMAAGKYNFE
jgi:hypothetical protein